MAGKEHRDYREDETATIVVTGDDFRGHTFEEKTESINISSSGISFYLNTFIAPRSFISVDLSQSKQFGYLGKVSAVVVRLEMSTSKKHLVAAEFI